MSHRRSRGAAGGGKDQRPDLDPVALSIEAKVRRAGKGKRLVIGNGAETEGNAGLVELIKEAFAIRNQFLSGSHDIRRLENGLERPCGRSRPAPRHLASLVAADAFAGALTRGSIRTSPTSEETTNTQRFEADSLAEGPGVEPVLTESESAIAVA